MKHSVWLCVLLMTTSAFAQELSGSACVPDSGNTIKDETIARALAKGQLAHELGVEVNARTELKTVTTESHHNVETTDVITEQVELTSRHKVPRVSTASSGYRVQNGQRHYCVTVKQG